MDKRPALDRNISVRDFKDFYWLKKELVQFCKELGINRSGSKIEISERLRTYLMTGIRPTIEVKSEPRPKSTFDWNTEELTLETVITDNYKNTENVRNFFSMELGGGFKFNVTFMKWMNSNPGRTMNDAVKEWTSIKKNESLNSSKKKKIAPQFEYNRYLRDFLSDNPALSRNIGIKLWKIKKSIRGDNTYQRQDLDLLK